MRPIVKADGLPLTEEILDYLRRHPDAKDTLEGIEKWWLLEPRIQHTIPQVKIALAELVKTGKVLKRVQKDGRIYYCLNRQK